MTDNILTPEEAAKMIGVPTRTLLKQRVRFGACKVGRKVLFLESKIWEELKGINHADTHSGQEGNQALVRSVARQR